MHKKGLTYTQCKRRLSYAHDRVHRLMLRYCRRWQPPIEDQATLERMRGHFAHVRNNAVETAYTIYGEFTKRAVAKNLHYWPKELVRPTDWTEKEIP